MVRGICRDLPNQSRNIEEFQHMTIYNNLPYVPYFYIIQDTKNGMYYAGSKFGRNANPKIFMIEGGYCTSSNVINFLLENFGLSRFKVRKIRIFETANEAIDYETRFLIRVNASKNEVFYNGHNNTGICNHTKMKQLARETYGVEYYFQTDTFKQSKQITSMRKYGVKDPMKSEEIQEKYKSTHRERYGVDYSMQNKKIKNKCIETNLRKHGVKEIFQSTDFKEKAKKTNLIKYGVEHACQSDLVKKKKNETRKKLIQRPIVKSIRSYQEKI